MNVNMFFLCVVFSGWHIASDCFVAVRRLFLARGVQSGRGQELTVQFCFG